jgi:hypothetical protein
LFCCNDEGGKALWAVGIFFGGSCNGCVNQLMFIGTIFIFLNGTVSYRKNNDTHQFKQFLEELCPPPSETLRKNFLDALLNIIVSRERKPTNNDWKNWMKD